MIDATQIPLDLPHRPALSGDDFFVAAANRDAVAWIDQWPDWSGPGLVIHGETGCGKSHLAQVFAAESGARIIRNKELLTPEPKPLEPATAYVIDDAEGIARNDIGAENLFHLFNSAKGSGIKLLLTGKTPASRWEIPLPDLRSRLNTLDQVAIAPPDDALLSVLLVKQFADRQLRVEPDVIAYLTSRMERSTAAAVALVNSLDREALSRKRAITVPLARSVLDTMSAGQQTLDM